MYALRFHVQSAIKLKRQDMNDASKKISSMSYTVSEHHQVRAANRIC